MAYLHWYLRWDITYSNAKAVNKIKPVYKQVVSLFNKLKKFKIINGVYQNKLYNCCTLSVVTTKITLKIDVAVVEWRQRSATSFHELPPPPHFDVSQGCWLLIVTHKECLVISASNEGTVSRTAPRENLE